jgi:peptidoglycan/LPS O-acetylase OafA/YrhL
MRGLVSIYLDVFRFVAAMCVFLSHADQHAGFRSVVPAIDFTRYDHKFVIVFFVISGYVIAASASRPDRTLANYSADRIARLSSVVIPALLLTYCLDALGSMATPGLYAFIDPHWQPVRLLMNLFYCQQIWFLCVNASSNTALWSLGYEFWYYVLFGVWIFVESKAGKMLLLLAVSLFIGPKILLLLPAWAAGALAFHAGKSYRCPRGGSFALFVVTGIGVAAALIFAGELGFSNGKSGEPPLYYSSDFVGDNLFAMVVAFHFFCCALFSANLVKNFEPYKLVRFVRWMASHTFSLYVYHLPLLLFVMAIGRYDIRNTTSVLLAVTTVLVAIAGLSKITEERYPVLRVHMRQWFGALAGIPRATVAK